MYANSYTYSTCYIVYNIAHLCTSQFDLGSGLELATVNATARPSQRPTAGELCQDPDLGACCQVKEECSSPTETYVLLCWAMYPPHVTPACTYHPVPHHGPLHYTMADHLRGVRTTTRYSGAPSRSQANGHTNHPSGPCLRSRRRSTTPFILRMAISQLMKPQPASPLLVFKLV